MTPHLHPDLHIESSPDRYPRWLRIGFWACLAIAIAAVVVRAIALLHPPGSNAPPQLASLDTFFAAHAALTWTHILCALVLVLLLPFLLWRRTAGSANLTRAFFTLGLIVAATAYAMSVHAVGGWLERSAVLFFNTLFIACLINSWTSAREADIATAQRWTLRAIAVLLGIATTRPVMGVFFATSRLTHLTPHQFFGIAFWIGFSTNTVAIELWLRTHKLPVERIIP
ncbi:MAG TPA: DUF2306 domain-containing protein [Acidobacteriaceae bacterium]|nr:DUF2306 domain-containing protein [Acidobacteriaceae bacterium]